VKGTAIDVDVSGRLFVLDRERGTLTLYDQAMKEVATVGGPGWEGGSFDQPAGLWARNGLDIYVADLGNHRIQRFDRTLTYVSSLASRSGDENAVTFGYPADVTVSRFGTLYICDTENNRVVKVDAANRLEGSFGGFGGGAGKLDHPVQVEMGPGDQVYVLDPPRVLVYDLFGNYLSTLADGLLRAPTRLAGDDRGIVVADGTDLVFFDRAQHPALRVPAADVTGETGAEIVAICLAGGKLYVLTPGALHITPDPRGDGEGLLDKESDNH
jgi:DNA-binding beta-propeller fold protein YncE